VRFQVRYNPAILHDPRGAGGASIDRSRRSRYHDRIYSAGANRNVSETMT
jgi:hypothetical protein